MSERRSELKAVAGGIDEKATKDFIQVTARLVEGWTQINGRLVALTQTSWKNAQDAAEDLRHAQNPREALDVQIRFARQTFDDYMDESRKLAELISRLQSEALGSFAPPK